MDSDDDGSITIAEFLKAQGIDTSNVAEADLAQARSEEVKAEERRCARASRPWSLPDGSEAQACVAAVEGSYATVEASRRRRGRRGCVVADGDFAAVMPSRPWPSPRNGRAPASTKSSDRDASTLPGQAACVPRTRPRRRRRGRRSRWGRRREGPSPRQGRRCRAEGRRERAPHGPSPANVRWEPRVGGVAGGKCLMVGGGGGTARSSRLGRMRSSRVECACVDFVSRAFGAAMAWRWT